MLSHVLWLSSACRCPTYLHLALQRAKLTLLFCLDICPCSSEHVSLVTICLQDCWCGDGSGGSIAARSSFRARAMLLAPCARQPIGAGRRQQGISAVPQRMSPKHVLTSCRLHGLARLSADPKQAAGRTDPVPDIHDPRAHRRVPGAQVRPCLQDVYAECLRRTKSSMQACPWIHWKTARC